MARLVVREVELDEPEPGEVLVRVVTPDCHTDAICRNCLDGSSALRGVPIPDGLAVELMGLCVRAVHRCGRDVPRRP